MPFQAVTTVSEVPSGTWRAFPVGDREVVVCNVDGQIYAVDNVCSHDDGPLDEGAIVGCEIECPRHGARFDLRNGHVTSPPAFLPIDIFPARVVGDTVEVDV